MENKCDSKYKYVDTVSFNKTVVNLPINFSELYISVYNINAKDAFMEITVPYSKLSDTRQSFYGGYYWNSSSNGACCCSISKTEAVYYGVSINGTEINSGVQDIYYR